MSDVAGILLAGGRSRRMGQDKALLSLPGELPITFLERLVSVILSACPEVVLVARDQQQAELYAPLLPSSVRVITDQVLDAGPLMGLYSGLATIKAPHALVVAVDTPLLQPALLAGLFSFSRGDAPLVPIVQNIPQVLCALYPRSLLPFLERLLAEGRRDVRAILKMSHSGSVQYLTEEQVRVFDPQLLSFININTPSDFAALQSGDFSSLHEGS